MARLEKILHDESARNREENGANAKLLREEISAKLLNLTKVNEDRGLKYSTVLEWAKGGIIPARIIQNRKKSNYFFVEKEVEEIYKNIVAHKPQLLT